MRLKHARSTSDARLWGGVLATFVAVAVLAAVDVASDLRAGTTAGHVVIEGLVVAFGLTGAALVGRRLARSLGATADLRARLVATEADAARWRDEARDLVQGLGAALDRQFERWQLSPAEKEVALLLLKGLSHKEIGEARAITDATARQQARAVYRKAGLGGRADLAAFFLEDLLVPPRG